MPARTSNQRDEERARIADHRDRQMDEIDREYAARDHRIDNKFGSEN